jgi:alpha-ketoglutarate-dependent taurine dioxygenase
MENLETDKPSFKKLGIGRRKSVTVSQEALVTSGPLFLDKTLPLLVQPTVDDLNLISWASNNREFIDSNLLKHGGILFRNFNVSSPTEFEEFISAVSGGSLEYRERSSPRSQVKGNIYTSTDYPPEYSIFLHNENSYQHTWPAKIFFFCAIAAQTSGETPIADVRNVYQRIAPEIREHFIEKGWMYIRNFGEHIGLPWQTVFQTSDRAAVEEYCRNNGIEVEWKGENGLRTRTVRRAVVKHPRTGEMLWFNHATFFHVSTLPPAIRDALMVGKDEQDLPNNTFYGDGAPIEPEVLDALRDAYHQETVAFRWQEGDVLMLDNMLVAHGRAPFTGPRKILVGMADPINSEDIAS